MTSPTSSQHAAVTSTPPSDSRFPAASDADLASGLRRGQLLSLLESSILPKVLEKTPPEVIREELKALGPALQTPEEIAAFAKLCLIQDGTLATAFARQLVVDGLGVGAIFDGLIAPAARHLGHLWDEDVCDFSQVTLGLLRMQRIAMTLSEGDLLEVKPTPHERRALFAPIPGSQHTLGVMMVSELFRSEGWQVEMETALTQAQLIASVQRQWFDVIGISISLQDDISPLQALIARLREDSLNPRVRILIGGPVISEVEGLELRVGADAAAANAAVAQKLAKALALPLQA